jgi:hypothetical protein
MNKKIVYGVVLIVAYWAVFGVGTVAIVTLFGIPAGPGVLIGTVLGATGVFIGFSRAKARGYLG